MKNVPARLFLNLGDYDEEYTEEDNFNELGEVTWCKDKIFPNDIEYVRKDVLLEWAREKEERLGKMFDAIPATAIGAKLDACKEFIDKIESL